MVGRALAVLRALLELLAEALFGSARLDKTRLTVRVKGVDVKQLNSKRGVELKAFTDGSVLASGGCGLAVYYSDGHPYNFSGGFVASEPDANMVELAAVCWVLLHHPRSQQLSIFSDSARALKVVSSLADVDQRGEPRSRKQRLTRAISPEDASLARVVQWLLRLRTAQTNFFKVPGHKGFRQNETADLLAQRAAAEPPSCCPPLAAGLAQLLAVLLHYLLRQSELEAGRIPESSLAARGAAKKTRRDGSVLRRPEPLGESTEITDVLALDCEMVGVGIGGWESSLASVSVVNSFGRQVYFSYAKPPRRVTDYRTWCSGITAAMLDTAPPSCDVQREVALLLRGKTVVGHGLENDFKALGYHHPRRLVRDSAHDVQRLLSRRGKPRKLRRIAWEFLGLTIQDGEHSPDEDALAALLLYFRFEREFEGVAAKRAAEALAKEQKKQRKAAADPNGKED